MRVLLDLGLLGNDVTYIRSKKRDYERRLKRELRNRENSPSRKYHSRSQERKRNAKVNATDERIEKYTSKERRGRSRERRLSTDKFRGPSDSFNRRERSRSRDRQNSSERYRKQRDSQVRRELSRSRDRQKSSERYRNRRDNRERRERSRSRSRQNNSERYRNRRDSP